MAETLRAEVRRASDGGWYFRILAGNNEVVATGETYRNRDDAIATASRLIAPDGDGEVAIIDDTPYR